MSQLCADVAVRSACPVRAVPSAILLPAQPTYLADGTDRQGGMSAPLPNTTPVPPTVPCRGNTRRGCILPGRRRKPANNKEGPPSVRKVVSRSIRHRDACGGPSHVAHEAIPYRTGNPPYSISPYLGVRRSGRWSRTALVSHLARLIALGVLVDLSVGRVRREFLCCEASTRVDQYEAMS
jgi:hypothetical protein